MDMITAAATSQLRINGDRLWRSLMELAKIGATPKGGVCRLTLTDLDRQGRDLVIRWGREAGLTVTIDKIGNVFMRRPGRNNSLPPIVAGSHIDTQPTGGKFDGNYGVLAGARGRAHAERPSRRDRGADRGRVLDERGGLALRAGDDGLGRVRQGLHARARLRGDGHRRQDGQGRTRAHRLRRQRGAGRSTRSARTSRRTSSRARCSRTTTRRSASSPACSASAGTTASSPAWRRTPARRRWRCARTRCRSRRGSCRRSWPANRYPPHGRGTVGMVQVHPNSRNVIPGRVKFSIDLRNASDALFDTMDADIRGVVAQAQRRDRPADRHRAGLGLSGAAVPRRLRERRRARRQAARLHQHARRLGRRARRRLHGAAGADRE